MLDPKRVLAIADEHIRNTHAFAADASADPAIAAVVVALCAELNRLFAPIFEAASQTEPNT